MGEKVFGVVMDINEKAMEWYYDSHSVASQDVRYWSLPSPIIPTEVNNVSSLSYHQLTSQILDPLIQGISTHLNNWKLLKYGLASQNSNEECKPFHQPVVAICIPEGPFLPIAVLAVHIHNLIDLDNGNNNNNDNCNQEVKPIILPLDPQEGEDRIKFMLRDSQPSFIMYIKNTPDGQKMENIVDSIEENSNLKPKMLDVPSLIVENGPATTSPSVSNYNSIITKNVMIYHNRISHIVYTSGTTGVPKGTISSIKSLINYIHAKNISHYISCKSKVFLASSLSFDPCLSDIIATFHVGACLCFCNRQKMRMNLSFILNVLKVTHVLCTPSLWNSVDGSSESFESLEVVALGGEVMSGRIKGCWARNKTTSDNDNKPNKKVKLLSTYGVTEACVYQTVGEVFVESDESARIGYDIGLPMDGIEIKICEETNSDTYPNENTLVTVSPSQKGEIVLSGLQLDEFSGYLNSQDATKKKFIEIISKNDDKPMQYFYRTGDRGLIDPLSGRLRILGRIDGEEGMVKINGVRVELGEIEYSLLDSESFCFSNSRSLVIGCIAVANKVGVDNMVKIVAYCVLSDECLRELGLAYLKSNDKGLILGPGPLMALLRARCDRLLKRECIPSIFILIPRVPLTRTGKRNRNILPSVEECQVFDFFRSNSPCCGVERGNVVRLDSYGRCGQFVYKAIIECLNLQPKQHDFVTTISNFAMLGGDSLAATLIVRSLYALHHEVNNTRYLGGEYGAFDGPFDVSHLLKSNTLGQYIDYLDSNDLITRVENDNRYLEVDERNYEKSRNLSADTDSLLYDKLVEAITFGQTSIAIGLLSVGVNPNHDQSSLRLGKLKNGRQDQKQYLKSNPLHLACTQGNKDLVLALLKYGCNCKSPDANGQYPLHLACSGSGIGSENNIIDPDIDNWTQCVRLLIDLGKVPLSMKNGSKQTVLHCAARSGNCNLLSFLMDIWDNDDSIKANKLWGNSKFDWQDRWYRTAVHWAILNGNVQALKLLLTKCSATPPLPKKSHSRSSVAVETPLEMCSRLYGNDTDKGNQIEQLLHNAIQNQLERCD